MSRNSFMFPDWVLNIHPNIIFVDFNLIFTEQISNALSLQICFRSFIWQTILFTLKYRLFHVFVSAVGNC
jgi:hypothetical protein